MKEIAHCCVCNKDEENLLTLGGRLFCAEHYGKITRNRKSMWWATAALILLLTLLAVLAYLFSAQLATFLKGNLTAGGVIISLIPAIIWLIVFYIQDRFEPEPKQYVIGMFILGALLAYSVGQPLIENFYKVQNWNIQNVALQLLAGFLITGVIQEFLKYAGVRYTLYYSQEFDERIDGIIYGSAIGLGYATMLNISFITANPGIDPGVAAMRSTITALAHASFGGISGYFLGCAKFEQKGPFWLPCGILTASVFNTLVTIIINMVGRQGFSVMPIYSLAVAAILSAAIFSLLFRIMNITNAKIVENIPPSGS